MFEGNMQPFHSMRMPFSAFGAHIAAQITSLFLPVWISPKRKACQKYGDISKLAEKPIGRVVVLLGIEVLFGWPPCNAT